VRPCAAVGLATAAAGIAIMAAGGTTALGVAVSSEPLFALFGGGCKSFEIY
jgi:hypothetical protein